MSIYALFLWLYCIYYLLNFLTCIVCDLQISHNSAHVHSGMTSRGGMGVVGNQGYGNSPNGVGGSIPGILPSSAAIGNRTSVPGLGVSPVLGNAGPRISSSVSSIGGGGNIGRNISAGGGLSVSGLASRLNLTANSGSGNLNVQGQNRLMGGVLQQGNLKCGFALCINWQLSCSQLQFFIWKVLLLMP